MDNMIDIQHIACVAIYRGHHDKWFDSIFSTLLVWWLHLFIVCLLCTLNSMEIGWVCVACVQWQWNIACVMIETPSIIALYALFDNLLRPKTLCIEMCQYWLLEYFMEEHMALVHEFKWVCCLLVSLFFVLLYEIVCQRLIDPALQILMDYGIPMYLSCSKIVHILRAAETFLTLEICLVLLRNWDTT